METPATITSLITALKLASSNRAPLVAFSIITVESMARSLSIEKIDEFTRLLEEGFTAPI